MQCFNLYRKLIIFTLTDEIVLVQLKIIVIQLHTLAPNVNAVANSIL